MATACSLPPETKEPEHHPQKYPLWLPWFISLLLLLVCLVLVVILVLPFRHSSDQPGALQQQQQQQQFSEWVCNSTVPQGTERGWTCCPKGWRRFQRSCYFLSLDKMTWAESEQNCTGMGSQLVVINSKAEQVFLSKQIKKDPKSVNFYIGLFEEKVGQWQWVDKTPYHVTAAFWRDGEPSASTDENCTVMHVPEQSINNWNDVRSDVMHNRICEAAVVTV
ncbi:C-type lectin domain family 4 member D-like isoform X2 [Sylvia atricapilla]|uniref:C-type lectin domain family 4 member D-like isoform X2 n=1 Tax=Sylvia atricapilla TaxID=48155 RepID=UPI0033923D52